MNKLFNFISLVALLALTSCNSATFITPDKTALIFSLSGGEEKVNISTDGSWSIEACPNWVRTEVLGNTLIVKPSRNETGQIREENIVLEGKGNVVTTILVTQAAKCTYITPSTSSLEFEEGGGTLTAIINTDGDIKAVIPDGFSATYKKGLLTVTAPVNVGGTKRGTIILSSGDQSATIQVVQNGNGSASVQRTLIPIESLQQAMVKPEGGYTNIRATSHGGTIVDKVKDGTWVYVQLQESEFVPICHSNGVLRGYIHYSKIVFP